MVGIRMELQGEQPKWVAVCTRCGRTWFGHAPTQREAYERVLLERKQHVCKPEDETRQTMVQSLHTDVAWRPIATIVVCPICGALVPDAVSKHIHIMWHERGNYV